jgi:hypothetical protein
MHRGDFAFFAARLDASRYAATGARCARRRQQMTDSELVKWAERVRVLFRGDMDELLFSLAKNRIAEMSFTGAWAALDDYAIAHGGARSRFIPGKFLEFVGARKQLDGAKLAAIRRQTDADQRAADRINAEGQVARETREQIEVIRRGPKARVDAAIQSLGWGMPPREVERWPRSFLIAVSDLLLGAELFARDPASGLWDRRVPAAEFYALALRPPESPESSSEPRWVYGAPQASSAPEATGEAYAASLRALLVEAREAEDVPF